MSGRRKRVHRSLMRTGVPVLRPSREGIRSSRDLDSQAANHERVPQVRARGTHFIRARFTVDDCRQRNCSRASSWWTRHVTWYCAALPNPPFATPPRRERVRLTGYSAGANRMLRDRGEVWCDVIDEHLFIDPTAPSRPVPMAGCTLAGSRRKSSADTHNRARAQ